MEIVYSDVDRKLVEQIDPAALGSSAAVFYASRRHWLEIIPEAIVSFWELLTVVSLTIAIDPFTWAESGEQRFYIGLAVGFLGGLTLLIPLLIEVIRWYRDIYFLTQWGWSRYYFDMRDLGWHKQNVGFIAESKVDRPAFFRLLGFNVGSVLSRGAGTVIRFTPLMPRPLDLERRMNEAKGYKPEPPKINRAVWQQ